jgi:hypothetical protein
LTINEPPSSTTRSAGDDVLPSTGDADHVGAQVDPAGGEGQEHHLALLVFNGNAAG